MKIATIIGARPQFIKASVLSNELSRFKFIEEIIIHTGQHYDNNMSDIFFKELSIPNPKYKLEDVSGSHAYMTASIMIKLEEIFMKEKFDFVLVYGDTNSTLAASLVASKLNIPIIHIEAGMRSFDMEMPEEINRILTDRISKYLFCSCKNAVWNLNAMGIYDNVYNVGDIMYDLFLKMKSYADFEILNKLGVDKKDFILLTIHRQKNTENDNLKEIMHGINILSKTFKIIFPIHPRTKMALKNVDISDKILITEPVSYLEMLALELSSKLIITDSGGIQKEAYFSEVPCVTIRENTEWIETVINGCNVLTGIDMNKIIECVYEMNNRTFFNFEKYYGDGTAAKKIRKIFQLIRKAAIKK